MRCDRLHLGKHRGREGADFPLGAGAAALAEEITQSTGVHRHDNARVTGVRKNGTGVFDRHLRCRFFGFLGCFAFGDQPCGVVFSEYGGEAVVMPLVFLHCGKEFRSGFFVGFDRGRDYICEIAFVDVALALHGVGRYAVAGYLCKERAGNAFDRKCEGNVLNRGFVPE